MNVVSRPAALAAARAQFESTGRLDMQSLAADLAIGRTTLYRRLGSRDSTLSEILGQMAAETLAGCISRAKGEGSGRAIDALRRFMTITAANQSLCTFLRREPDAALRSIITSDSAVTRSLIKPISGLVSDAHPTMPIERVRQIVDVIIQVGMVFLWANIASCAEPQIDRAMAAVHIVLDHR